MRWRAGALAAALGAGGCAVPVPVPVVEAPVAARPLPSFVLAVTYNARGSAWNGMAVHAGNGVVHSAAHIFDAIAPGQDVGLYPDPGPAGQPQVRRARVVSLDRDRDLAVLELRDARGLAAAPRCAAPPRAGEPATVQKFVATGPAAIAHDEAHLRGTTLTRLPQYPADDKYRRHAGLEARVFTGASRPGMSGSPVLAADLGCFHGVVSFSDHAAAYPLAAGENPLREDWVTVAMVPGDRR